MAKITPGQRRAGQLLRYKAVQRLVLARGRKPKQYGPVAHPARVVELVSSSVYVSDLARSRAFYESVVGLEAGETVGPSPHPFVSGRTITYCALHGRHQRNSLILIEQHDAQGHVIPVGDRGLMHVAFLLEDGQSPYDVARRLKRQHIPISYGPIKHYDGPGGDGGSGGNIAVYVHDPDAHMVEIYCCMDRARTVPGSADRPEGADHAATTAAATETTDTTEAAQTVDITRSAGSPRGVDGATEATEATKATKATETTNGAMNGNVLQTVQAAGPSTAPADITVPVLIVGGGGAGLTASMLLSAYGVDSLLVSKYPGTSHLPKAHVLHQKTMEIYRELGVAEAIYARATPPEHMSYTAWYAGFAGPHDGYGREIGRLEAWGSGHTDPNWIRSSQCPQTNLPQIRLEPILKAHTDALGPQRLRFNHAFVSLTQDDMGVTALIEDRGAGRQYTVRARYLLGCDGGRVVGKQVGVTMDGMQNLATVASIHMSADLSPWARDPEVLIRWMINPDMGEALGSGGILVPMGPDHWGPQSEEWVFHLTFPSDDPAVGDDAHVLERMRAVLGVPDFAPTVHLISRWTLEGVVASRMQVGNVFLLGDAAHRHPPTGGLGLNMAAQDAYNLCWKLAAVVRGQASATLLATYEQERRPVVTRAVMRSIENSLNHQTLGETLGISSARTPEENWERVRQLWSDDPAAVQTRLAFEQAIHTQRMEFYEQNVEYGCAFESPAIIADGTPPPAFHDDVHVYQPSTRPGSPLPHAWLQRDGQHVALGDLAGRGSFLLIAGEDGTAWLEAGQQIAQESDIPLQVIRIGGQPGDWIDVRFDWLRQREIGGSGAVLVRPDRVVAWRSLGAGGNPCDELRSALAQILGVRVSVASAVAN